MAHRSTDLRSLALRMKSNTAKPENDEKKLIGFSDVAAEVQKMQIVAARRKKPKDSSVTAEQPRKRDSKTLVSAGAGAVGRSAALLQYFIDVSTEGHKLCSDSLDVDYIQRLVAEGADVNVRDRFDQTILHEVARSWNPSVMMMLVRLGGDLEAADSGGRTPLHSAAASNFAAMCKTLVKLGAERERRDQNEQTPVFHAARTDSARALRALIGVGCDFRDVRDYRGRTPIYVAAELDRSVTVEVLLRNGADAFVQDHTGQIAFVPMVQKMPQLAKEALKQLHRRRRIERLQSFDLFRLDPKLPPSAGTWQQCRDELERPYHSAMKAVTATKSNMLVITPVLRNFVRQQWLCFGRSRAVLQLVLQLVTICLWTAFAVIKEWTSRFRYDLPGEAYRIVILIGAIAMTLYSIGEEFYEYFSAKRRHDAWKEWRVQVATEDSRRSQDRDDEQHYYDEEIKAVKESPMSYFDDAWNYLDWAGYIVLLASLVTHFVDVGYPGGEGNLVLARWHVRLMAINIVMQWLRLLKYAKPFEFFGPFIVTLGMVITDLLKFLFLYMEFFIPFSCVFWIILGGKNNLQEADIEKAGTYENYLAQNFTRVTVQYFDPVNSFLFSVFRITLVDNFDYDSMAKIDNITAQVVVSLWLGTSAILVLNLFIAQLSETFKIVYDNAKAIALMEKAASMQGYYEAMLLSSRMKYHRFLANSCHPLTLPYDDDVTGEVKEEEMQKAKLQIRDVVVDLCDKISKMHDRAFRDRPGNEAQENVVDDSGRDIGQPVAAVKGSRTTATSVAAVGQRIDEAERHIRRQFDEFSSMLRDVAIVASAGRGVARGKT